MKNQKIIALGLAVGLIVSAITPSIAETINKPEEVQSQYSENIVPFDMEKYKDFNEKLGNSSVDIISKPITSKSTKKRADISVKDFEQMYNSGMTHDEIVDVLETAGEQGEQMSNIISEVKKSNNGKGINKENLKKELKRRNDSKDSKNKKVNESGKRLREHIAKKQKEGKLNNTKITIIDDSSDSTLTGQDATQPPRLPSNIAP